MLYNDRVYDKKEKKYRTVGDTYPEIFKIKVDGNIVDLNGWNVYLYYIEGAIKVRLTGTSEPLYKGNVIFSPNSDFCDDITDDQNIIPYTGLQVAGNYEYEIVREKTYYYADDAGLYIIGNEDTPDEETYILYDDMNPEHTGKQRFTTGSEKMSHNKGTFIIADTIGI